jgi:uncharacterized protein (DUF342 family)
MFVSDCTDRCNVGVVLTKFITQNNNGLGMANQDLAKRPIKICDEEYSLRLSKDKLSLTLELHGASAFDPDDWPAVLNAAHEHGAIHGLMKKMPSMQTGRAVIAKGTPPVHGKRARIRPVIRPEIINDNDDDKPKTEGRVDFRELGHIVNVPDGQLLLEKVPATAGVHGRNILGTDITAKDGKDVVIKCGPGVVLSDDGIKVMATATGKFVMENGKPAVLEEHVIDGDIDMSIGNVTFCGKKLIVTGAVGSGFKIKCMGSVTIGGGIHNAEVIAGESLVVRGGLIGEESVVKCWGDLDVDFCENTGPIEAKGNVVVQDFIVQGDLRVGKNMKALSGKGALIGGTYILGGSLYALELGSDAEVVTEITVGLNPSLEARKIKLEGAKEIWPPRLTEMLKDITALSAMKKEQGTDFSPENVKKLKDLNIKMPKVMDATNQLTVLEEKLNADIDQAANECVYVHNRLYPGVSVTIGSAIRVVSMEEKGVVVEFEKSNRKIHIRSMTTDEREVV